MNNFEHIYNQMREHGMKLPSAPVEIRIPDAKQVLSEALNYFLALRGETLQWLPEYDSVAEWLTHNQGRGLFMYGNCGRGKSLLGRYVIPAILLQHSHKIVSVYDIQEMNRSLDEALSKHIISVDDIGTEEVVNTFGNRRLAFAEIMDLVEKRGKLVIISTNLQREALTARYGDRIFDRILATTKRVPFNGNSMRK